MAPEIVLEEGYDHTADWFSFGVVLLEAALGR
jgi:serine/threonine protein kinase